MGNGAKVALVVVGLSVVALVCLGVWGMGLYETEVCDHLKQQPAITEKTGPLVECSQKTMKSGDISDLDTFVFDVRGDKASGVVYVKSTSTGEDATEEYQGILAVVNGEEILVMGERPPTK